MLRPGFDRRLVVEPIEVKPPLFVPAVGKHPVGNGFRLGTAGGGFRVIEQYCEALKKLRIKKIPCDQYSTGLKIGLPVVR